LGLNTQWIIIEPSHDFAATSAMNNRRWKHVDRSELEQSTASIDSEEGSVRDVLASIQPS
jgi:hypothetical protein